MPLSCTVCDAENRDGSRFCARCGAELGLSGEEPLIGQVIGERYRVVSPLGEGGMGRVYLADQQMGTAVRKVAMKVLRGPFSQDARLRTRFYRECEVVVGLTHPHTIQFYDFGELPDGRLYIVMEYVDGCTLAEVIEAEGALAPARVERLLRQIAGSLTEAHERGIIHRDLKPDNVMLTARGGEADFVKVCDFGIAKQAGGPTITQQGTMIGTPQYMSPEQLTGSDVDARSDVYSLGVMLFEMLTGTRPFAASSPMEWIAKHSTHAPPDLGTLDSTRGLPPHQRAAVASALEKLPEQRPQSALALAQAFLDEEDAVRPITMGGRARATGHDVAQADTLVAETPTPVNRRLLRAAFAVGAVAATVGFFAYGYLVRPPSSPPPPVGVDAGPPADEPAPVQWIRIVHYEYHVDDTAAVLGAPDGRFATIRSGGTLTLELAASTRIATDGGPGPDIYVQLDDERSGPYRLDVGVARQRFTTAGAALIGSMGLDADQFEIDRIRYIRLKNRSERPVLVDAVGVYRSVRVAD